MANIHSAYEAHGFKVQLMELSAAIKDDKAVAFKTWLIGNRKNRVSIKNADPRAVSADSLERADPLLYVLLP